MDNNFRQPWRARLYDEFGRHDLALEGEEAWFSPAGIRRVEKRDFGHGRVNFQLDDWHEYHLTAIGKDLTLRVNGEVIAVAHDGDGDSFEARGILAMQLHTGPTMKAQFRNIRLKAIHLVPIDARESIIAHASLHWDMGERANAHQPPLAAVGKVTLNERDGERAARLSPGHFHAQVDLNTPRAWNVPRNSLTSHVRGSIDPASPSVVLWSKGKTGDQLHFHWSAETVDGKRVGKFSIRTEDGIFAVMGDAGGDGIVHDWLARYTGESLELWTDGKRVASTAAQGDLLASDAPILIGSGSDSEEPTGTFAGDLIEVSLWNQSLTDAQVARITR